MSTIAIPDRFTTLPDEQTIASAVTALEEHGFASASGSQLASYAWGAANVIFVVGAQKLVPTLEAAHERIYQHSLVLEDARAIAAYGQHSSAGKILEIHQELPGRIHIVLIRQVVGF
jgi:protoporphyrinogen oxidase